MRSRMLPRSFELGAKLGYASIGAVLSLFLTACSKPAAAPEPVPAVRTLIVARGETAGLHEYAAEVRAQVESRLAFRVAGKLMSRAVGLGEVVRPGQVLASLEPQDLQLNQEAARSGALAARVAYNQAVADFARFKALRDQGFISAAELERRESGLKAAQAQFEQADALAGVQVNLARYGKLVADTPGVVTAIEADPGTVLAAGTPVLRVAQDGPRDVVFSVPEDRIASMRALLGVRDALRVRLWGADAKTLTATVREVAAAADAATRTFVVKASLRSVEVRLGQSAAVSVPLPAVSGVMRLPLAAVFEHQGKTSVWRVDPATMTVRAQAIELAANATDGEQLVVRAGLESGQRIVSAGAHVLTQGQKVRLYGDTTTQPASSGASAARP